MIKTVKGKEIFKEYGIIIGERYLVNIPYLPTPMMVRFGGLFDYWGADLMKLQGKEIIIKDMFVKRGLPFVSTDGCSYIIPIDCLDIYHEKDFEPDEGVEFF